MKRICFLPVVLLLTGLLCGCTGQQQNDPSPQEHNHAMEEGTETPKYDHLTVYSPLPESETLLYCSAFRKDTGITVDCIHLPAGEMTARLEQERDNPQASVLLGGSADNYIQLREAGLLEAYQSPELTDVPEAYQDEQGVWNPIYRHAVLRLQHRLVCTDGNADADLLGRSAVACTGRADCDGNSEKLGYLVYHAGNACADARRGQGMGVSSKIRPKRRFVHPFGCGAGRAGKKRRIRRRYRGLARRLPCGAGWLSH